MTQDILLKMEKRRIPKSNTYENNKPDNEIRSECQLAKERMFTEQCEMLEQLEAAHKLHQIAKCRS